MAFSGSCSSTEKKVENDDAERKPLSPNPEERRKKDTSI